MLLSIKKKSINPRASIYSVRTVPWMDTSSEKVNIPPSHLRFVIKMEGLLVTSP
jgi:hypothetical protein